ncbi:ScbR family autoregulator-binding transcription factor [Frondihabitans australicus]|uniref:ScbR family autoregulator-binding transcription factor n=1 Tax=Frondihabitans australicus TaxID=386892 RepID=UPI001472E8B5|nr:ScbR family autoregulator-binding transcription factor [Frondihabitans australicus]
MPSRSTPPSGPTASGRRPSQERAQATRAAVLLAAASVFAERGYARTTLDVVALEAGVTKGALYFHFASKHDLANAVIAEQTRVMREGADEILAGDASAIETLILLVAAYTERMVREVVVAAGVKLITEEIVAALDIVEPYEEWDSIYTGLLERAIVEGDLRPDIDCAALSHYIIGAYTGVQQVSNSLTQRADLPQRVAEMWRFLLPGVVPTERLEAVLALPALAR